MNVAQLKTELQTVGQSTFGKKSELIDRLKQALEQAGQPGRYAELEEQYREAKANLSAGTSPAAVAPVTTPTAPPRGRNQCIVSESKTSQKWTVIKLPQSKVIEDGEGQRIAVGPYLQENARLVRHIESVIAQEKASFQARYRGQHVPPDHILLLKSFLDEICDLILKASESSTTKFDGIELCKFMACLFILGCVTVSDELAFSAIIEPKSTFTLERYREILKALKIVAPKPGDDPTVWPDPASSEQQLRRPSAALNAALAPFRRAAFTYDDDIENTTSAEAGEKVNVSCIVRKDGWCVVWDTLCSVIDGIPAHTSFRESGGKVMEKFVEEFEFFGGEFLYFDRYYTCAATAERLKKKNVSTLGPMKVHMSRDHPFDVHAHRLWDSPSLPPTDAQRTRLGITRVETFPGVGPNIGAARNDETGTMVYVIRNRTTIGNDGIIKMMGSTCDSPVKVLEPQNVVDFVRKPKSLPPIQKRSMLTRAARQANPNATKYETYARSFVLIQIVIVHI